MPISYETYRDYLNLLLERLKPALGEGGLLSCCLFGSVARGEASVDSDIDLLIVHGEACQDPLGTFLAVVDEIRQSPQYRELLARNLRPDPYPVFLTERDLWDRPLILLDAMDHGIMLWDSGVLERRFAALRQRLAELGAKKIVRPDGRWYWDLKPDWQPGEVVTL